MGLELDPKYVDLVVQRWQKFTGKKATREEMAPSSDPRVVEAMAAGGIAQADICQAIGVSAKTLRKYFPNSLKSGQQRANAGVIATLYRMATSGKDVAALPSARGEASTRPPAAFRR